MHNQHKQCTKEVKKNCFLRAKEIKKKSLNLLNSVGTSVSCVTGVIHKKLPLEGRHKFDYLGFFCLFFF